MSTGAIVLLSMLVAVTLWYIAQWFRIEQVRTRASSSPTHSGAPGPGDLAIGFVTNFFDTLGIGSFAPTTAIFKLQHRVADENIPGTLNAGHALPTIAQALIFISIVSPPRYWERGLGWGLWLGCRAG